MILTCRQIFDVRRVQEWTAALSRWCATQHGLKPYRGQCLVHRSEIMQMRGEWADALDEVQQACAHLSDPPGDPVLGMALYQQAELLRLRGDFARAEKCYREASGWGHPVQPGLALLRLAQGRRDDAAAAIQRTVLETEGAVERSRVLSAYVEIKLGTGDHEDARAAVAELDDLVAAFDTPYLRAVVGYARGCVLLAGHDAAGAIIALRRAWVSWHELDALYETARVRLQVARACRLLGDHDTAELELDAARRIFEQLGAVPALDQVRSLTAHAASAGACGLTAREIQVLRLVATGATNREIADSLVISDRTVARHVSNMFSKLGVPSRAAATAFAYEHDLV
jgi:DNA-binding CsgD family transcriptional regulator